MNKFSKSSASRVATLNNEIQWIVNRGLIILGERFNLDCGVPHLGAKRTEDEQFLLFSAGSSTLDGKNKKSYHQSGMACDFFAYYDGKAQWDYNSLHKVHAAMYMATEEWNDKESSKYGYKLKCEWGGFWESFEDCPHNQWVKA